ncbi:MAG: serine/threonine-protein kinase [Pseudomonadales bacterium]
MSTNDDETRLVNTAPGNDEQATTLAADSAPTRIAELQATVMVLREQPQFEKQLDATVTRWLTQEQPDLNEAEHTLLKTQLVQACQAGTLNPETFETLQRTIVTTPAAAPPDATMRVTATGSAAGQSSAQSHGIVGVGTVIKGRFELQEKIGEGGMGEVYKAKDLVQEESKDRQPYIAIKVLAPEFAKDSNMRIALQREAGKAHSLAHPNVITVYDFDREADTVFLTMELLTGQTLKELIADHPMGLPREQAFDILRGMSLGLAYAHNKGIVHSDFKTGNVFYTDQQETKILDFGIARAVPRTGAVEASEHTRFDVGALGALTPSYASPEMLAGEDPGPNDDVFALALVAYQLLTGKHPFGHKPADQAAASAMVAEQPKTLSKREWRALKSALSFDGAERPADASAFLRLLEGTSNIRKLAIAAALGLALTSAYVIYDSTTEVLETRPDVAFEALTQTQQQTFEQHFADAQTAARFNDLGSALDLYVRAYRIHPRNAAVVDALDQLVERVHQQALQIDSAGDRAIVVANLERLAKVDGFLKTRPALTRALSDLR